MADSTMIAVLVPDAEEGAQFSVGSWAKAVGDTVMKGELLLELSTDKVQIEVTAPASGVLQEIRGVARQKVEIGQVLGIIDSQGVGKPAAAKRGESVTPPKSQEPVRTSQPPKQGDSVRVFMHDQVRAELRAHPSAVAPCPPRELEPCPDGLERIPHTELRRSVANHMSQSMREAPQVTSVMEVDFNAVVAHRAKERESFRKMGIELTYTAYIVRAAAVALRQVPQVNARWTEDALELVKAIHIGVGVAREGAGVVVPVVRDADTLSLVEIATELQRLTERARTGLLSGAEMRGGTFTISNHGVSGSLMAAPIIIHQPQVAILGVGKVERRAVVVGAGTTECIEARSRAYVTLTLDHRALDAFLANQFLRVFIAAFEDPERESVT